MKRNLFHFLAVALLLAVTAIACKPEVEVAVTGVTLDKNTLALSVDESVTLTATIHPVNAANRLVSWTSTEEKFATVNGGRVTGKATGITIITVTTEEGYYSATCKVTVTKPHPAEPEMIWVEGGKFIMGCSGADCSESERPPHQVTLTGFNIAKNLVTQEQWKLVMGNNHSTGFQGANLPVERVSWQDAQNFIKKLNELTGKEYRLATEAEWEYAARGGSKSREYRYSGGDNINDVAWYTSNANNRTHPVGTKFPNELGIFDMSGNVREWCNDYFEGYTSESQTDPQGPAEGTTRVVRNGGWFDPASRCRISQREGMPPGPASQYDFLGFRLVHP